MRIPWSEYAATDNRVQLLFLLRNGFKHDLVRLFLLGGGSLLIKYRTATDRVQWARVYSCHSASILLSWMQLSWGYDCVVAVANK